MLTLIEARRISIRPVLEYDVDFIETLFEQALAYFVNYLLSRMGNCLEYLLFDGRRGSVDVSAQGLELAQEIDNRRTRFCNRLDSFCGDLDSFQNDNDLCNFHLDRTD
jgi:hypothetical protein